MKDRQEAPDDVKRRIMEDIMQQVGNSRDTGATYKAHWSMGVQSRSSSRQRGCAEGSGGVAGEEAYMWQPV